MVKAGVYKAKDEQPAKTDAVDKPRIITPLNQPP